MDMNRIGMSTFGISVMALLLVSVGFAPTLNAASATAQTSCRTVWSPVTPLTTVYVGQNLSVGSFTVELQDLTYPNANGVSDAVLSATYNGVNYGSKNVAPGTSWVVFNFNSRNGAAMMVHVKSTQAGLYANQRWAKMRVYSGTKVCG